MIILESILLWTVAGIALMLIMHYVMKSPQTPDRPQAGLGKRYPIGARRVKPVYTPHYDMETPNQPSAAAEVPVRRKTKKQTDTMQLMLSKAMAERR